MNISYHSFLPHLGYGAAAKGYISLLRERTDIKLNWIVHRFEDDVTKQPLTEYEGPNTLNFIHLHPNYITRVFDTSCPNLVNTVFESTQLPASWKEKLAVADKIAVPCTWNQQVFQQALNRPINLLPHLSQFCGQPPKGDTATLSLPGDKFVFLTVGTWELRKNLEELVRAFCQAFTKKDPVVLIIKTSENDLTRQRHNWCRIPYLQKTQRTLQTLLRFQYHAPDIRIISDILPDETMQQLYYNSHAYVTLTHGEGWGMGAYEAAWYGKPVIATGFGGYLDFLDENTATLIPYKLIKYKKNFWDTEDFQHHYYAQPQIDYAIDAMRSAYDSYKNAREKGKRLSQFVQTNYSQTRISDHLSAFLAM